MEKKNPSSSLTVQTTTQSKSNYWNKEKKILLPDGSAVVAGEWGAKWGPDSSALLL